MDANDRAARYQAAALKAVDLTTRYQLPDGSYIWEGYVNNAYHKQVYAWPMGGRFDEAHRLLNWAKKNTLQPDGQLKDYLGDVYKQAWFFQGAHRLGRFDLSYPVMSFLLSTQAPCGGFPRYATDALVRSVATSFMGMSALLFGRLDVAEKAARCCLSMLDQQPDPARFYCQMTPDGKLVTDAANPKILFVDTTKTKQIYYEAGIPMMLMCRLHQVTGDASYIEHARRFFEFHLRCREDNFAFVWSGKGALAAALYYSITGDERARDAAIRFCDFLVDTQLPDGSWHDPAKDPDELLYYLDHAAEYIVWLYEMLPTLESGKTAQTAAAR